MAEEVKQSVITQIHAAAFNGPKAGRADYVHWVDGATLVEWSQTMDALVEALEMMQSALNFYVEEVGGIHLEDCPEDDTCECPNMKLVNGAWSKAEAAIVKAEGTAAPSPKSEPACICHLSNVHSLRCPLHGLGVGEIAKFW